MRNLYTLFCNPSIEVEEFCCYGNKHSILKYARLSFIFLVLNSLFLFNINGQSCCERTVSNTTHCATSSVYSIYLKSASQGSINLPASNTSWLECSDGTATFTGVASGTNGSFDEEISFTFTFTGKTSSPPSGSPRGHTCLNENTSGWVYYPNMTGIITTMNGGTIYVSRDGASFQVGNGANVTSNSLSFGASGWFDITSGGNGFFKDGDINIMLSSSCNPTTLEKCYAIAQHNGGQLYTWDAFGNFDFVGTLGVGEAETMSLSGDCNSAYTADGDDIGTINLNNGVFTLCGSLSNGQGSKGTVNFNDIDGMAIDNNSGLIWAVERESGNDLLLVINPNTCDIVNDYFGANTDYVVLTGALSDVDDLAFNPCSGNLYGVSTVSGSTTNDVIVHINTSTGAMNTVATLNECDIEGLSFNENCELFGSTGSTACQVDGSLYKIDIATQTAVLIGTFPSSNDDVEALVCCVSAPDPPSNNPPTEWDFDCSDDICVDIIGAGIKNNLPKTLNIPNSGNVTQIVAEATYDGSNAPTTVTFSTSSESYAIPRTEMDNTGCNPGYYYRVKLDPASSVTLNGINSGNAESFILYVFRQDAQYDSSTCSGVFAHQCIYKATHCEDFILHSQQASKDIDITVPLSEITNDGRVAHVTATACGVTETETISTYTHGNSLNIVEFTLDDVPGNCTTLELCIESPSTNGQSLYLSGAIQVEQVCSTCDNLTSGGQIGYDQSSCDYPFDPALIQNIQSPSGGSGAIEYIWLESTTQPCSPPNTINDPDWSIIAGANSSTYNPPPITVNTCYIRCARREGCEDYLGESNIVTMIIEDDQILEIVCPSNDYIDCDESSHPDNTGYATASSLCGTGDIDITWMDELTNPGSCPQIIERTWTATVTSTTTESCVSENLAHWNFAGSGGYNICELYGSHPLQAGIPPTSTNGSECNGFSVGDVYKNGASSCVQGAFGSAEAAACVGSQDGSSFVNNDYDATKFTVSFGSSDEGRISEFCFYERARTNNENFDQNWPPQKYGIRVLKNGSEIYKSINNSTSSSWSQECFDFSSDSDFEYSGTTTFTFELLSYDPTQQRSSANENVWEIDEFNVYGCCGDVSVPITEILTCVQTITIDDTEPPVITGVPADITVSCADGVPPVDQNVEASDNCAFVTNFEETISGNEPCDYVITRTWSATDDCDNSVSKSQEITVKDETNPDLTGVPQNVSIDCFDDIPDWTSLANATDNCGTVSVDLVIEDNQNNNNPPNDFDCCDTGDKVQQAFMKYTGESCSATSTTQQADKHDCDDYSGGPNGDTQVYVIANSDSNHNNGDVFFTGNVNLNEVFNIDANNAGENKLSSNTYVHIFNQQGGTKLQLVKFHASCSAPVVMGEQFGSLIWTKAISENGSECNSSTDIDECYEGELVITYIWTATDECGNEDSETRTITVDENDPPSISNLPNDTTVECHDEIPDWSNLGTATDDCDDNPTITVTINDDSDEGPEDGTNCCDGDVDIKAIHVQYTAESCSATSTVQTSDKYDCDDHNGGPNGDPSVYVIANDMNNPNNGLIWFAGDVMLNEIIIADATTQGENKLKSNTYFHIYNQQGGTLLQVVKIHTSCSVPVVVGDQFGSLVIKTTVDEMGGACGGGGFGGDDCCDVGDKPNMLTLTYTGEGCGATNTSQQPDKHGCDDYSGGPNGDNQVFIIVNDDKEDDQGLIWFTGSVNLNEAFTIASASENEDDFKSRTYFHIFSHEGGTKLQRAEIHTSCSAPLVIGEQVGSILLNGVKFKDGSECTPPIPEEICSEEDY